MLISELVLTLFPFWRVATFVPRSPGVCWTTITIKINKKDDEKLTRNYLRICK